MAMEKISVSLDAELAEEARQRAGQRGMSRLVNTALRQHLQAIRLQELEQAMVAQHGPISDEARARATAALIWPE